MPEPAEDEGDLALACAFELVDELARRGTVVACVSPGSRSTPLALALARHGGIPIHVHLDERSSAFFALGAAKATGRPVAVVTTSGTAVANLFPAVVEAAMSGVPLVLLTADRPPELRGTGANQTIDQVGIFGTYPRWAVDAHVPSAGDASRRRWRELAATAVAKALGPPAGPVHLNLPFREPLIPSGPGDAVDSGARSLQGHVRIEATSESPIGSAMADRLGAFVTGTDRGLVMVGSLPPWTADADLAMIAALADRIGWPVVAEPASNLRRPGLATAAGQHLLADAAFVAAMRAEAVLQIGGPPTSRAAQAFVARASRLAVVAGNAPGSDPTASAGLLVSGDPVEAARLLLERIHAPGGKPWRDRWIDAGVAAEVAVDAELDASEEPFEGRIARDLAGALAHGATLFAGSSMPIRDLDAYAAPRAGLRFVANRGASGIDGSVSTALGIAAAGGVPTFALIGDLAVLHDAAALLWCARRGYDVVFVVPNNRGGGIFDHLPVAAMPERERLFVTPHDVDLAALCAAVGAGYSRVERAGDLPDSLHAASDAGGVQLLEVPIDRRLGIGRRAQVRVAVRRALAGLGYEDGAAVGS